MLKVSADETGQNAQNQEPPNNSDETNTNVTVSKHPSTDEDEQNLMSKPVYQKTTEHLNERKQSLNSFEKVRGINCRTVLYYVTFVGFMVNYMLRINMNIAIVEMVARKPTSTIHQTSECIISATINSTPVNVIDVSFSFLIFTFF